MGRALACLLATAAPAALAQGQVELSLEAARGLAEQHAPDVLAARGRVEEAEGGRAGAGLWLPSNPVLQLDGRTSGSLGLGAAANLTVALEPFGAPASRAREAERRLDTSKADEALARLEARLAVTAAYVGTGLARLEAKAVEQSIALAERLLAAAREREKAGAGSAVDVTSAQAELATRQAELLAARAAEALDELTLRELTGLPPGGTLTLSTSIEAPGPAPRAQLDRSLDLQASDARLEQLAATQERLEREVRPRVGLVGQVDAAPASPVFGAVGLAVELPVAQRNQGPRAVNAASQRAERTRRAVVERHLALAQVHRTAAHDAALSQLEVLTRQGIPVATERLRLVEEGFRAGRFDVFKVTAAASDLVQLESRRLDALRRLWTERLALERLQGGL
ncbi:MAG: TolC family protein [Myxococcaceae bacterium]|nr:TolC family protein [Myxococcaceae bacterium]